ncbi:MAG: sulfatase-like hydrolase/transferase, partial [Halobacteriaceae archaeon]
MPERPNILFVITDQQRHDWVGWGDAPVRTPTLDGLLAEGVAFENAVTPSPVCGPARSCLAAGVEYDRCPVRDHHEADYPLGAPTLYGHLRDAGYHTLAAGKFDLQKHSDDPGLDGTNFLAENGFSDGVNVQGMLSDPVGEPRGPYQQYLVEEGYDEVFADEFPRGVGDTSPTALPPEAYQDNW